MNKKDFAKFTKKYLKEIEDKKASMTFGEFLYCYYFGEPNISWDSVSKDYKEQFERYGKEIIKEVLRRNKK